MNNFKLVLIALPIFFNSCIGEDIVNDLIPESIKISADPNSHELAVGDSIQFSATFFNDIGDEVIGAEFEWKSSDISKVTIDSLGLAIRQDTGGVTISVCSNSIEQSWSLDRGLIIRTGTFDNSYSSYRTIGSVSLEDPGTGDFLIRFHDDADIGNGPKLYLILANSINSSYAVVEGSNPVNATFAQITANKLSSDVVGETYFTPPSGININDYDYVVFYCAFGVVFGYATLD